MRTVAHLEKNKMKTKPKKPNKLVAYGWAMVRKDAIIPGPYKFNDNQILAIYMGEPDEYQLLSQFKKVRVKITEI